MWWEGCGSVADSSVSHLLPPDPHPYFLLIYTPSSLGGRPETVRPPVANVLLPAVRHILLFNSPCGPRSRSFFFFFFIFGDASTVIFVFGLDFASFYSAEPGFRKLKCASLSLRCPSFFPFCNASPVFFVFGHFPRYVLKRNAFIRTVFGSRFLLRNRRVFAFCDASTLPCSFFGFLLISL